MDEVLVYFAVKYKGNFQKILTALQNKERVSNEERKKVIESINCNFTTIISDDYPNFLKEISCPPFVLFYKGDLETLNSYNTINIVGTENNDINGEEKVGDKIKNNGSNAPKDWYDYSNSKWANIVVKANGKETYFTWIPRYEFKITSSQQAQPATARTEVRFIEGTSSEESKGYQIPEAFTFDGKQLSGYWAMKYTAGE